MSDGALTGLSEIVQQAMTCASRDRSLVVITDGVLRRMPQADHASIRLCTDDGDLRPVARSGVGADHTAPSFRKGEGVIGWVAAHGQAARVRDSHVDQRFRPTQARGYPVGSLMSVPLSVDQRVLGVLSVSSRVADAFGDDDEALVTVLASIAAQLIRIADLERLAITDAQTMVFNQRYLLPRLEEEMRRAERDGQALSVLLMDLDHFKQVNDEFGHAVGDMVLRMFTDGLRRWVRAVDIVVRRGGEEFVLIMPSTGAAEALHVAERIRASMEATPMRPRADVVLKQTVSIGAATWNGTESAAALDERADQAMYDAKNLGRNRVVASGTVHVPRRSAPWLRGESAATEAPRLTERTDETGGERERSA